jgi:hypothetical protein
MPYVCRNEFGLIESLHRGSVQHSEFLADDHAEVQAFVGSLAPEAQRFDRLDADFVRVIEDLIDTLISKNIVNITDLPEQAQAKLLARKSFRERVSQSSLHLFNSSGFGDVI